ncbi:MAG TPA: TlpA disulfide reductase family protein [Blastocatellia bacterium]|nr:TlpA disulfide reductase family protein [Blastocatellia bacterium]
MKLIVALSLFGVLISGVQGLQLKEIVGTTGEPVLYDKTNAPVFRSYSDAEYQQYIASKQSEKVAFVPIKHKPDNLSPDARFGFMNINRVDVSWALQGDDVAGYTLYLDLNENGDLADDRPWKFEKNGDKYELVVNAMMSATEGDTKISFPIIFKVQIAHIKMQGQKDMLTMLHFGGSIRRGVLRVDGKEIAFGLLGTNGTYDRQGDCVLIDKNGDGKLDAETPKSSELYKLAEKYINIGQTSYQINVDRFGRSLTLTPLAEKRPDRAKLTPGDEAPDFSFTDLDGKPHKLSDYRGKLVLIDFWGSWCFPCVVEAPKMVETYNKLHDKGFEIIGIDRSDKEETVRKFIADKNMTWVQTREEDDGPLNALFRVDSWPSHFLIDRDGKVIRFSNNWAKIVEEVDARIGK